MTISTQWQVSQLSKFKSGMRGQHPADTYGQQMAPMVSMLEDEQSMRDVVAYITTLR
jgi:cytochrome c oxidase subunit 2